MTRFWKAFQNWLKPRKSHSFPRRFLRYFLFFLPIVPLVNLIFGTRWYDGFGGAAFLSFCWAVGDYAFFNVYGGTDEHYADGTFDPSPQNPVPKSAVPKF